MVNNKWSLVFSDCRNEPKQSTCIYLPYYVLTEGLFLYLFPGRPFHTSNSRKIVNKVILYFKLTKKKNVE